MTSRITPHSRIGSLAMPVLGLGTWQASPEEIDIALNAAIDAGYRHIDTAYVYMNEEAIGNSLKKIFEKGVVKREDLFIVTKLPHVALRAEHVEPYLIRSLTALQLTYLDLYLVHMPVGFQNSGDELFPRCPDGRLLLDLQTDHISLWKAMEAQVDAGRTRHIGVSNFNLRQTKRLLESSRIPPSNNQVELHVYLQQRELVSYCQEHGVTVTAYAPLGSSHLPAFNRLFSHRPPQGKKQGVPLEDPVVLDTARKYGRTPAQVLIRFLLQLGVAVIPKSSRPHRITENFKVFDFELAEEDVERLRALDRGEDGRMFAEANEFFAAMRDHPEYPYRP